MHALRPRRLCAACLGSALLALFLWAGRPAQADGPGGLAEAWRGRTARLVTDLEEVAGRLHASQLFRARNEVYETLLHFAPDHGEARKWLRYRRQGDGTWTRPDSYRAPANQGSASLQAAERDRAALADAFAKDAFALLQRFAADPDPRLRARIVRDVLLVSPGDARAREMNAETRTAEGGWMLAESVRTISRRTELQLAAARALEQAPAPERARPTREENAARLAWTAILTGRHARLLGTVPEHELERAQRHVAAAFPLFAAALGDAPPASTGLTFYVLGSAAERTTLLTNHPDSTPELRAVATARNSSWFPGTRRLFVMHTAPPRRLEWCVRQALAWMLGAEHGVRSEAGWAFEGFGLYLGHLLTGTRATWYVHPTPYDEKQRRPADELWVRLGADRSDWRAEARALLAGPDAPNLRLLLGKDVNQMSAADMLVAYVLAAYCLEGQAQRTPVLLRAVGKEKLPVDDAVQKGLGLGIEELELRLRRWLEETS